LKIDVKWTIQNQAAHKNPFYIMKMLYIVVDITE